MDTKNIENYLNSFGKQVVNRAIGNLGKKKGGNTALAKTIKFEVIKKGESFSVQFSMDSYGKFVDKGVSGKNNKRSFKDYTGKVITTPYSFGTGSSPVGKAKGGMSGIMTKWIKKKGFQWKDKKTGRFMSHKSMGYIIARSIYSKGIQGISFFQKPLGLGLKQFGKDLLGSVKEDIINSLTIVK
mgnify:CR=1 FL=1|tara:strand:+ start:149 stop:700 length:552 start_codon:yes stop_codon:yes gene_type:complete